MTRCRATSLDVFRGYAIITMILSGTITFGILPGWMYHAQTPPPQHAFNPQIFGITWVDLVFPFFLFAMGAAFPFSIGRKIEKGVSRFVLIKDSVIRGFQLTFFAIFIQHMYPWVLSSPQDNQAWLLSLGAFALMFPMFMRLPLKLPEWGHLTIKLISYGLAFLLLFSVSYADGRQFSLGYSNIIILILANMAIFGSLSYIYTHQKPLRRLAILPFIMAVFLGSSTDHSWIKALFNWSPAGWMYQFYYLKYLFIVIPGSIAGGYLHEWLKAPKPEVEKSKNHISLLPILFLSVGIIVLNLYCLYTRLLVLNLFGTIGLIICLHFLIRPKGVNEKLWRKFFIAGSYLLLLGLFFEAYEGGIRKDDSTYSYYFVSSGLAFFAMIVFSIISDVYRLNGIFKVFKMAGQNPMIAYVAPNLVVMPLLSLLHLTPYLDLLNHDPWCGFLRGLIVTSLSVTISVLFTRIKWFWRT
ncbi:DUF5009 domain-containing protein [Marinilabiliaceae bacterium JC017]|nr:DUF5009 domain-containing protein [Marinilabiliaceae bacterium JC017]